MNWRQIAIAGAAFVVLCGLFINFYKSGRSPDEVLAHLVRKRMREQRRQGYPEPFDTAARKVFTDIEHRIFVRRPRPHFCTLAPDCNGCTRRYVGRHR